MMRKSIIKVGHIWLAEVRQVNNLQHHDPLRFTHGHQWMHGMHHAAMPTAWHTVPSLLAVRRYPLIAPHATVVPRAIIIDRPYRCGAKPAALCQTCPSLPAGETRSRPTN